jgi:hypothetical protein
MSLLKWGISVIVIIQDKEINCFKIGKGEVKLSRYADDMML